MKIILKLFCLLVWEKKPTGNTLSRVDNLSTLLPMNEGIALDGDGHLVLIHESGAEYYREDGGEDPTDCVWRSGEPVK